MAPSTSERPVYDRLAARYDRAMRPWEKRWLGRWRAEAFSALPEGARLLEIGAGTGANFAHYPYGAHGVASELSCRMLEFAREKNRPNGVSLVQCSAERLPFADGSFEAACATLVFCSVPSPAAVFGELRRVVKPGGRIVLLEHVRPAGLLGPVFDFLNLFTVPLFDDHFNRRTVNDAQRSGLSIESESDKAASIIKIVVCKV
jgi:ubiquinone/menaquinone biosynthesis C-methylase UbiE